MERVVQRTGSILDVEIGQMCLGNGISCRLCLQMLPTAWLAAQPELTVSGSFQKSEVSDCCNVNSERKGVNHPNAYLIFMFTYQRVAHFCLCRPSAMHVQWLFLYLCFIRDPTLSPSILGAPCIPGLTQGLWGLWDCISPSLLWDLCVSHAQFPTGQWSLWPHFSLWEVMQFGIFIMNYLGLWHRRWRVVTTPLPF